MTVYIRHLLRHRLTVYHKLTLAYAKLSAARASVEAAEGDRAAMGPYPNAAPHFWKRSGQMYREAMDTYDEVYETIEEEKGESKTT